jgi:hypothetical protein
VSSSNERSYSLRPGLRPLVILGAPRSGTKLLRSLLGQSAHCTTIPYGINHVWRTGLPPNAPDRRPATDATDQRTQQIRSHLLDLADAHHTPTSGYLVEKTCANTLRVPFVNRVLPDAQFIHILRDGRDAAVSAREKWNRPPSLRYLLGKLRYVPLRNTSFLLWYLRNLWQGLFTIDGSVQYWGPRYEGIGEDLGQHSLLSVCARQWQACVSTCLDDLEPLPPDRLISIRYETLVSDRNVLDRLIEWLSLTDGDRLHDHHKAVVHERSVGRWRDDLSPSEQQTVTTLLKPTLERIRPLSSPSKG